MEPVAPIPAPRRKSPGKVTRDEGVALTMVGVLIGIGGLYLYLAYGPSSNGRLLGEVCLLIFGLLFVSRIVVLAIAKPAPP